LRFKRTTGLTALQFNELVHRVSKRIIWTRETGRPKSLTIAEATRAAIMYLRTNMTQELIGEFYGVGQRTISRIVHTLTKVIGQVLSEFVPVLDDLADHAKTVVFVIDGTLLPSWSWAIEPRLWSGKHKTTGHSVMVICTINGRLLYMSDPVTGNTHDAKLFDIIGLGEILTKENSIGDTGFIGKGITTPYRTPPKGKLLDWQKEWNTSVSEYRWIVERTIAHIKTWRILHTDYRRPLKTFKETYDAVRALHFFRLGFG